jgi:hypothetical protein
MTKFSSREEFEEVLAKANKAMEQILSKADQEIEERKKGDGSAKKAFEETIRSNAKISKLETDEEIDANKDLSDEEKKARKKARAVELKRREKIKSIQAENAEAKKEKQQKAIDSARARKDAKAANKKQEEEDYKKQSAKASAEEAETKKLREQNKGNTEKELKEKQKEVDAEHKKNVLKEWKSYSIKPGQDMTPGSAKKSPERKDKLPEKPQAKRKDAKAGAQTVLDYERAGGEVYQAEEGERGRKYEGGVKPGYFNVKHLHDTASMDPKDHAKAKQQAHDIVDNWSDTSESGDEIKADPNHVRKIKKAIDNSENPVDLADKMKNFMLAHPDENLGLSRGGMTFNNPTPAFFKDAHVQKLMDSDKPMEHGKAKARAHKLVDNHRGATDEHRDLARRMIEKSKSSRHLATGMKFFIDKYGDKSGDEQKTPEGEIKKITSLLDSGKIKPNTPAFKKAMKHLKHHHAAIEEAAKVKQANREHIDKQLAAFKDVGKNVERVPNQFKPHEAAAAKKDIAAKAPKTPETTPTPEVKKSMEFNSREEFEEALAKSNENMEEALENAGVNLNKDELVKSLFEHGMRESAILLKNWDEMDANAQRLQKSVFNAGMHPMKGKFVGGKGKKGGVDMWDAHNKRIHAIEQAGNAGSPEHKKLTAAWERETGREYKVGHAAKELGMSSERKQQDANIRQRTKTVKGL